MYRNALKAIYILLASSALLIWLESKSISLYWQQAYHKESPLNILDKFSWWQKGSQINDWLLSAQNNFLEL